MCTNNLTSNQQPTSTSTRAPAAYHRNFYFLTTINRHKQTHCNQTAILKCVPNHGGAFHPFDCGRTA